MVCFNHSNIMAVASHCSICNNNLLIFCCQIITFLISPNKGNFFKGADIIGHYPIYTFWIKYSRFIYISKCLGLQLYILLLTDFQRIPLCLQASPIEEKILWCLIHGHNSSLVFGLPFYQKNLENLCIYIEVIAEHEGGVKSWPQFSATTHQVAYLNNTFVKYFQHTKNI